MVYAELYNLKVYVVYAQLYNCAVFHHNLNYFTCTLVEVQNMTFKIKNTHKITFIKSNICDVDTTRPKSCCYCPFHKGAARKPLLRVLKAGTCPGLVSNKEAVQNGSVLVEDRFTETTDSISYNSLNEAQIGSYPTLRKASFTQCDDLDPFSGDKSERAPMIKVQRQISKALVYLQAVCRHSGCFK